MRNIVQASRVTNFPARRGNGYPLKLRCRMKTCIRLIVGRLIFGFLIISSSFSVAVAQWKLLSTTGNSGSSFGCLLYKSGLLWSAASSVMLSTDHGVSWIDRSPASRNSVYGIDFFDANTGAIAIGLSNVQITHDQGRTWNNVLTSNSTIVTVRFGSTANDVYVGSENSIMWISHDGGSTWKSQATLPWAHDFSNMPDGSMLMYQSEYGINHVGRMYRSLDRGDSWTPLSGVTNDDSWNYAVSGCDAKTIYVVNEQTAGPNLNQSIVYVSRDGGASFSPTLTLATNELLAPVAVAGQAVFVATLTSGIMRSTDFGQTWKSIGGPRTAFDSRDLVALSPNELFAVDIGGDLYHTTNSGGDSLTSTGTGASTVTFLGTTHTISRATCDARDTSVFLASDVCAVPGILDSLRLTGSSAFQLRTSDKLPRTISSFDSIPIRYSGFQGSRDTAFLHITYTTGTVTHDTVILLIGNSLSDFSALSIPDGTLKSPPGTTLLVPVGASLPSAFDASHKNVIEVTYVVTFDNALLDMTPSKLSQLVHPPTGWTFKSASIVPGALTATFSNPNHLPITDHFDLGSLLFSTFQGAANATVVRFASLQLTLDTGVVNFCVGGEGDFIAHVIILSSGVEQTASPFTAISVYPDPSHAGSTITLSLQLEQASSMTIEVLNILGESLEQQAFTTMSAGNHTITLSPLTSPGTYYVRCQVGTRLSYRKIVME